MDVGMSLCVCDQYQFFPSYQTFLISFYTAKWFLFLTQNMRQDPNLCSLREAHSTETALVNVDKKLHVTRAAIQSLVLVHIDLCKGFNIFKCKTILSVPHENWWHSMVVAHPFLPEGTVISHNREIFTCLCRLSSDIPQSSVLGPLLFS